MSITPDEARQEEFYGEMVQQILEDHRDEIIDEFVSERMASYYKQHPDLLEPAVAVLDEARKLKGASDAACLVFAQAAIEIALRDVVLKPVVFGMVHEENTGSLIAELVVGNRQFKKLLFSVLEDYGLDLKTAKRKDSSKSVWEEIEDIQKLRNRILHRGELVSERDALLALKISEFIIEKLFPNLRKLVAGE